MNGLHICYPSLQLFQLLGISLLVFCQSKTALPAQNPCDTIFAETQMIIGVQDCASTVPVCLPVFQEAFLAYEVFDNGLRYTNGINGCAIDTTVAYSYAGLLGTGSLGPYLLESWQVNGTIFSGEFLDIPALVDSLNFWDPQGEWQVDSSLTFTIIGGFNDHFYGAMEVSKPGVNNSTSIFGINYGIQPQGSEIYLSVDFHELMVQDTALGCWDTIDIHLACLPTEQFFDTMYVETSNTICLDLSELPGNISSITEQWMEGSANSILTINALDPCIAYSGTAAGWSRHLILVCDDLGFCDSTYLSVVFRAPENQLFELNLAPGTSEELCINTDEFIGAITSVDSLCANGNTARFDYNQMTHCLRIDALDYGSEMACYELCDQFGGCILAEIAVTVRDEVAPPLAQNDVDTLSGPAPFVLDLTANDNFDPTTDSLEFTTLPQLGTVAYLGNGQVTYSTIGGTCGQDFFSYRLCNSGGCSVAVVTLERVCDDIRIYSGFSPNGDARNDFFTIQGIGGFPESELQIFDRWGVRVLYRQGYQNDWAAQWDGRQLPDGTYFYLLELNDVAAQQYSGYLQIHR
ncbi:MAG: gliding motility-associated C-terminal domain-containing protein [Bacteroidota bacterium]